MYSDKVRDHFLNPRNVGALEDATVTGRAVNPVCGDTMELYLRVENGVIQRARYKIFGCEAAIAAGSILTEMLTGRTVEEARGITDKDVARALGGLPPEKIHCSILAEDVLAATLRSFRSA